MNRLSRLEKVLCLILLSLSVLALQSRSVSAASVAGYDSTILAVDVVGNERIPSETILKVVTHVRLGEEWNADKINQDIRAIESLGYFASVEASGEPFLGGLKLLFHVKENPLMKELKIEGLTIAKSSLIVKSFSQKKGEVINTSQLMTDLSKAIADCRDNQGYLLILKDTNISEDGIVTLRLVEVKVRKISVAGLVKTKPIVVMREITVKEGEVLNVNDLKDDVQNIYRLGILENINPNIINTADPEWVDLTIEVTEVDKLGQFYVGFGYSPSSGRLTANTSVSYPNLWGLGRTGSFNLQVGKEDRTFSVEYYDPWFLPDHISFRSKLYYDNLENEFFIDDDGHVTDDKYDLNDQGLSLMLGWPISKKWMLNSTVDFKQVSIATLYDGQDLTGDGDMDYWNNSIGFSLYNNNLLYQKGKLIVTGGHYNSLSTTFHTDLLGGDYNYTTLIGETKQFVTPWENGPTFGVRLKYGNMFSQDDQTPPRTDRFSIGGPNSIRGYSDTQDKGTEMFLANGEIRFYPKLFENVELVGFYDYGFVNNENSEARKYTTYGVGVRVNVPMLGPIRLDYGWNGEGDTQFTFFFGEMF